MAGPTEPKHPEHLKLKAVKDRTQCVGDFLEWLDETKGLRLTYRQNDLPFAGNFNDLLAEYFEIDLKKLEAEKREMLEEQRAINERAGFSS